MKATLGLEAIGGFPPRYKKTGIAIIDTTFDFGPDPCWIAEIVGLKGTDYFQRRYLYGKRDYSRANSKGTRGIFVYYILESGTYYEVKNSISWSRSEQYLCKVDDEGSIIHVDKKEVQAFFERKIMKEWQERKDGMRQKTNDGN